MLDGHLKHCHNFISLLNRINDGDDLRLSGSKFQSWVALYGIKFSPYPFEIGVRVSKTLNCCVLQKLAMAEKSSLIISSERP